MTLILTLGNSDQVIQVSDRRLSWDGKLIDDDSSKAGLLTCPNARLAFGFTGLARWRSFRTRDWLLDALFECGPPDYGAGEILGRLRTLASNTFMQHAVLRAAPRKDRRLSIMFSGYLDHHTPPLLGCAILTNYQNFQSGQDEAEAWDEFSWIFIDEQRPAASEPALIQRVGAWSAMTLDDEVALRDLLRDRKPAEAIIGKAVELVRQMADRPAANKAIGKQLSVLHIPRVREQEVRSRYDSNVNSDTVHLHDVVNLVDGYRLKDLQLRHVGGPGLGLRRPVAVSKVGRNQPCPCGSGKKYKHCHGRFAPPAITA